LTGTTGATGILVYNTDSTITGSVDYPAVGKGLYYFDGTGWVAVHVSKANAWSLKGNANTDPATNYFGTQDNQPINFRVQDTINAGFISRPTDQNTAFGVNAGSGFIVTNASPSTAAANTAIGYNALRDNISGTENVAVGRGALTVNKNNFNTGVGAFALNTNITGDGNTAVGSNALTYLEDNFSGATKGGSNNTAVGYGSLDNITSGDNITAIGYNANAADSLENTTVIGANAFASISNAVVIGATGVMVGVGTDAPRAELDVPGTGAIIMPVGTTSNRPATPAQGMIRYNTTTSKFEGYDGSSWVDLN
jgi:hypothetical protein